MTLKELKIKRQKLNEKKAAKEKQFRKIIFSNKEEFQEFCNDMKNNGAAENIIDDLISNCKSGVLVIPDLKTETLKAILKYS